MAEAQPCGLQDEFTCSVCLHTLTDPVTIPCGHNFCLKCLTDYWDQSQVYSCPQCRHTFTTRPELNRNTLLNEVIKKFKRPRLSPHSSQSFGPGDVECDFCTGKFRAVKSCLTCEASYCQTHLQPHYEGDTLMHHKLVDPDRNLKGKHDGHEKVKLKMEREEKQKQLGATLSEIRRRLEKKEKKMKEMRRTREQIPISVERVMEEHKKSFTDLKQCIEEAQEKLTEKIREQEKRETEKAEGVKKQLKKFSETKDHLYFLKTFPSRCVLPADEDSISLTVTADFSSKDLLKELSGLKKCLKKISQWDILPLTPSGREAPIFTLLAPEPQSREEFLQYFCLLTLDINTAHRVLRLTDGNKKVTCEWTEAEYPDHPDRFDRWPQVLCREALTGTRCYWEVECSGGDLMIGVAYKGLRRKGRGVECTLGYNNKSWCFRWSHSQYFVCHNNNQTVISAPYSPRIGVYLDWPAGSLSFYSVSHTMTLLHRFNTSFTEPLCPGFGFGPDCSVTICHLTPCDH
ncbi:tripartite motif-containing protein 16-like [Polypterus senegalus]|uniref:tripartite motif-containing protein 16-like n=1 Tax=Polypterus senegalus TaxID=55291 RepID=UPI001966B082|nr:tripartite motif-containing protein 16-like [Polypterus senegalus]